MKILVSNGSLVSKKEVFGGSLVNYIWKVDLIALALIFLRISPSVGSLFWMII